MQLNYVSPHLKHFSKHEEAISKLGAVFESLYAWLKVGLSSFKKVALVPSLKRLQK